MNLFQYANKMNVAVWNFIVNLCFLFLGEKPRGRTPRYLRNGIKTMVKQINEGKDVVWRAYTKQFLRNWKINYEFVYKAYFMKLAEILKSSSER